MLITTKAVTIMVNVRMWKVCVVGVLIGWMGVLVAEAGAGEMGEVVLPPVFGDRMVLQREMPVPVWGTAEAGGTVRVAFGDQEVTTKADGEGRWMVTLKSMRASAEGRRLSVNGKVFEDVVVGEVWIGSGQSNMAFPMRSQRGFAEFKETLNEEMIRFVNINERPTDTPRTPRRSKWERCSAQTAGECSAVMFYFARGLGQSAAMKGVPIGLVNASVGGTSIRLWIDRDLQMAQADMRQVIEEDERQHAAFDEAAAMKSYYASERYTKWLAQAEADKAAGKKPSGQPYSPVDLHKRWVPAGTWFKVKVEPLIPMAVRGVLWYQGEADGNIRNGLLYRRHLPMLIGDWRERWGRADLPFGVVQLPYWKAAPQWFAVREAQMKVLELPGTGVVVTIDVGDANDVHPGDKKPVGDRLARWALGTVYGQDVEISGPIPSGHEISGSTVRVRFHHAKGLTGRGGELKGFVVAGKDQQWHEATARIEGESVIVSSEKVEEPVAVRYAWDGNPEQANLYNGAGLPASPFRTDDWPLK